MMTPEELQAKLEETMAANEKLQASVEKLEAKNREVIGINQRIKAETDAAKEAAEEAATQAALKSGDVETVKAQAAKEAAKLQAQIEARDAQLATLLIDTAIQTSLVENGVAPAYHKAVTAMLKADAKIVEGRAVIGDAPLVDHIKGFVASDEGKHFVPAMANSGAGATGSKAVSNQWTAETYTLTEYAKQHAINPAQADAIAQSVGKSQYIAV